MTEKDKNYFKVKISRLIAARDSMAEALESLKQRRDELLMVGYDRRDFFAFNVNVAGLSIRLRQDDAELQALKNALDSCIDEKSPAPFYR